VPAAWAGKTVEAIIDLGFDKNMPGFQCEGLVYRPDGSPVKGLNPRNQWVRVADRVGVTVAVHPILRSSQFVERNPGEWPQEAGTGRTGPEYSHGVTTKTVAKVNPYLRVGQRLGPACRPRQP